MFFRPQGHKGCLALLETRLGASLNLPAGQSQTLLQPVSLAALPSVRRRDLARGLTSTRPQNGRLLRTSSGSSALPHPSSKTGFRAVGWHKEK